MQTTEATVPVQFKHTETYFQHLDALTSADNALPCMCEVQCLKVATVEEPVYPHILHPHPSALTLHPHPRTLHHNCISTCTRLYIVTTFPDSSMH